MHLTARFGPLHATRAASKHTSTDKQKRMASSRRVAVEARFKALAEANGLVLTSLTADGEIHRCPTTEKPRRLNGAYRFDGRNGWVKNWSRGRAVPFGGSSGEPCQTSASVAHLGGVERSGRPST
jgi:hypothetical protein